MKIYNQFKRMKTINYLFFMLLFSIKIINAQENTQTVRGTAFDKDSKQPLIGAIVSVVSETKKLIATTDANGVFKIINVPLGRQTLKVTYLGYEPLSIPDIIVTAGKEVVLDLG